MARRRLPAKSEGASDRAQRGSERASPCIISVECFIYSLSERNARVHLKFPCCNLMLYPCPKMHSRTSLRTMRSLCSWARRECSCNLFASTRFLFLCKTGFNYVGFSWGKHWFCTFASLVSGASFCTLMGVLWACLLYTSPSPRDVEESRMPSSA